MPKKRIAASAGDTVDWVGLSGWQATGLSLAVAGPAVSSGLGALLGAVLVMPVILALVRLRAHASTARTTAGLVGSTLGDRAAIFTGALQTVAYTLLAVSAAQAVGLNSSFWLLHEDPLSSWLWPLLSVAAVAIAGFAAYGMSDRAIGSVVAVLVAVGLLIQFYLALAILARVYAGSEPLQIPSDMPRTGLDNTTGLLLLALALVGFEVVTSRNQLIRSAGRPMNVAIAAATSCAIVVWLACHFGATGGSRLGVYQFPLVVDQFYGIAGDRWLIAAGGAVMSAALLALMWAVTKVASRLADRVPDATITALIVGVAGLLIVACCRDWGALADKLANVAKFLLVAVYVLIVEASSRIPRDGAVPWWLRLVMPAVLVAVVLLPLLNTDFAMAPTWPVLITAVLAALCYATARSATASQSSSG
jgi:ethanolamine permease